MNGRSLLRLTAIVLGRWCPDADVLAQLDDALLAAEDLRQKRRPAEQAPAMIALAVSRCSAAWNGC